MKHGLSISLRLTLWYSAMFLSGFAALGVGLWLDMASSLEQGRDKTLTTRARRAIELLQSSAGLAPSHRNARARDFADITPEGKLIQVFDLRGQPLLPVELDGSIRFPWPDVSGASTDYRGNISFNGHPYRVYSRLAHAGGQTVRVFAAGQLEDNRAQLDRFKERLLSTMPLMLVAAGIAGYFLSHRALNPVARLIDSGRSITIGNLSRRLPVSGNGDELDQLAETWNGMLSRLEPR